MTNDINNDDKNNNNCNNNYTPINNKQEINSNAIFKSDNDDILVLDDTILDERERNLAFCIDIVLKEAVKEDKLVKQLFYTMLSAYTTNPVNLAINAPSGEGKSHTLTKVGDLFPKEDVLYIADMSNKAIFHKSGYLAVRDEDGKYVEIESELVELQETLERKKVELKTKVSSSILEIKKEIDDLQQRIKEIKKNTVKVIDLNHKIMIFLDTPKKEIFEALMSLLSHDKYEVEYQYVDTSDKVGLRTKTNVLIGWPAVIFAQAIDYTQHPRYEEIQRRFLITNPKMDVEKYKAAVDHIIEKNSITDFVYQQKVVSDKDKDIAKEIIIDIRNSLLSFSNLTKPGKNNVIVPFPHLIKRIVSKNNSAQDMTFASRLMNQIALLTSIYFKNRPYLEVTPIFESTSFRIPLALFSDLIEALSLINNSTGGIRPYVLDWFHKVFLDLYNSKEGPNSKVKKGEEVVEERKAVTTQELIEKSKEVMNKNYNSKSILSEYIYPLSNLGYIDDIKSEIDGRANIYFPVDSLMEKEEKSINLFFQDQKNKLLEENDNRNINSITTDDKEFIISNIEIIMKYYSENKNLVTIRNVDNNTGEGDRKVEDIVNKYYSELSTNDPYNNIKTLQSYRTPKDQGDRPSLSSEQYFDSPKNDNNLQNNGVADIKNIEIHEKRSNNIFTEEEKNKLIYSCYFCGFESNLKEIQQHCMTDESGYHNGRIAYFYLPEFKKYGTIHHDPAEPVKK